MDTSNNNSNKISNGVNIIVLIKQVPDPEAIIKVSAKGGSASGGNPDGQGLEIENKYVMNFFDELAVEEALGIREKSGSGTVTVISLGPHRALQALRTGIAMGADRAILINDPALDNSDSYIVAKVLSQFIKSATGGSAVGTGKQEKDCNRKEKPDIILCGKEAMDDNACQVGPAVAEFLGLPHLSNITKLDIADDKKTARVERQIEGGKEIVECSLPAIFTTQKGINEPRVPLVTGVMKAMRAKIEEINLATLGLSPDGHPGTRTRILKYYEPPRRTKVKIIDGELPDKVKNLVRLLREEAKVI